MQPLFAHYFRQMWGGAFAQIFKLSYAYTTFLAIFYVRGRHSQQLLQLSGSKKSSFTECVLQETSDTSVDTKPKGIEATWIISDDRNDPA